MGDEEMSKELQYAVVKFIEDDDKEDQDICTVSEIPITWLLNNNTYCWWPPSKNASIFINKAATPNISTWTKHKISVEGFCKSLSSARKKADDINYTSSEEFTQMSSCSSRIKKTSKKKFPCEDWAENDSESDSNYLIAKRNKKSTSPPPSLHQTNDLTATIDISSIPIFIQTENSVESITVVEGQGELILNPLQEPEPQETNFPIANLESGIDEPSTSTVGGSLSGSTTPKSSVSNNWMSDPTLLRQIFDTVSEIKLQMKDLAKKVLHNEGYASAVDNSLEVIRKFVPLENLEALQRFEEFLKNEENKAIFRKFVNVIGGHGPKDNIYRVYKQVYSDVMAISCSWLGHRNNVRMCDKKSIIAIKGIMLNTYSMRENEFESFSAEWFRHARQRLTRKK